MQAIHRCLVIRNSRAPRFYSSFSWNRTSFGNRPSTASTSKLLLLLAAPFDLYRQELAGATFDPRSSDFLEEETAFKTESQTNFVRIAPKTHQRKFQKHKRNPMHVETAITDHHCASGKERGDARSPPSHPKRTKKDLSRTYNSITKRLYLTHTHTFSLSLSLQVDREEDTYKSQGKSREQQNVHHKRVR